MKQTEFCIVGLGLLGGSYAMGLTRAGHTVTAVDVRPEAITWAAQAGIITAGTTQELAPLLARAEAVVLGLYPTACVQWLQEHQHLLRSGALITDVSGVKCGVVEQIQTFLRPDVEFIASHPMAGKEVSGVEYADCAMFAPANFLITPTAQNSPRAIAFAQELAQTLGFARITQLTCAEHDRMIGYVSQLTHVIAVCLMNAQDNTDLAKYTGDSFRDLTRIARINDKLWTELFLLNKENLTTEIDMFARALADVRQKLADGDAEGLAALLRQSTTRRAAFDRQRAEVVPQ